MGASTTRRQNPAQRRQAAARPVRRAAVRAASCTDCGTRGPVRRFLADHGPACPDCGSPHVVALRTADGMPDDVKEMLQDKGDKGSDSGGGGDDSDKDSDGGGSDKGGLPEAFKEQMGKGSGGGSSDDDDKKESRRSRPAARRRRAVSDEEIRRQPKTEDVTNLDQSSVSDATFRGEPDTEDTTNLDQSSVTDNGFRGEPAKDDVQNPSDDVDAQRQKADWSRDINDGTETGFGLAPGGRVPSKDDSSGGLNFPRAGRPGSRTAADTPDDVKSHLESSHDMDVDDDASQSEMDEAHDSDHASGDADHTHDDTPDSKDDSDKDDSKAASKGPDRTARLLSIFSFVEEREQMGLSAREQRTAEIARFERMDPAEYKGWVESTRHFTSVQPRTAGRKVVAGRNGTGAGRVPAMGRGSGRMAGPEELVNDELALL